MLDGQCTEQDDHHPTAGTEPCCLGNEPCSGAAPRQMRLIVGPPGSGRPWSTFGAMAEADEAMRAAGFCPHDRLRDSCLDCVHDLIATGDALATAAATLLAHTDTDGPADLTGELGRAVRAWKAAR